MKSVREWGRKWEYEGLGEKKVEVMKDVLRMYDVVC